MKSRTHEASVQCCCSQIKASACMLQNALPSLALASLHQAPDTSHGSCTSQHDIAADELQWLWEEAQAAMQDSVPSTSDALSADQKQPPQQPVQSDMAALKFPLTAPSCSIKSETTMAGELSQVRKQCQACRAVLMLIVHPGTVTSGDLLTTFQSHVFGTLPLRTVYCCANCLLGQPGVFGGLLADSPLLLLAACSLPEFCYCNIIASSQYFLLCQTKNTFWAA